MKKWHSLTEGPLRLRGEDEWGSGAYGAARGERTHRGIDIVAEPGVRVLSPINGEIVREAKPYEDDDSYGGILICGAGSWQDTEIKMFYLDGYKLGPVLAGEPIGVAQNLSMKYAGIINHVHLEVWQGDKPVDPTPFFADLLG